MTLLLLCDVCKGEIEDNTSSFSLVVPARYTDNGEALGIDVCDAACLRNVALSLEGLDEPDTQPELIPDAGTRLDIGPNPLMAMDGVGQVEMRS
jgi:hypothetical protein